MSNKAKMFFKHLSIIYLFVIVFLYFLWAFVAMSWFEPINDTFLNRTGRGLFIGLSFVVMLMFAPLADATSSKAKD